MKKLPILKPNDTVEIIAPASRCTDKQLADLKALCESWQLKCLVAENIFGKDLFCANSDDVRFENLKNALLNPTTKAIICARGGYGSMRLIPELTKIAQTVQRSAPTPITITPKIFIGMSDVTALHLYLQQQWQWPTVHGALAQDKFSAESIQAVQDIMFGNVTQVEFSTILKLNQACEKNVIIDSSITGGNLCLVQASIGTNWQIEGKNKIIFLEEVGERGYRVDRMLEHLTQANIFKDAAAILFGDFLDGKEPDGSSLIIATLKRFADHLTIPVAQINGIGHGNVNLPIILGTSAKFQLGKTPKLTCIR